MVIGSYQLVAAGGARWDSSFAIDNLSITGNVDLKRSSCSSSGLVVGPLSISFL